jgi:hypothetical protein
VILLAVGTTVAASRAGSRRRFRKVMDVPLREGSRVPASYPGTPVNVTEGGRT